MTVLAVKDVSKTYRRLDQKREVLKNISFSVKAGDFVNLRGSNGAGKSTLIGSILGLQQIDCGTIEIFGLPPDDPRSRLRVGSMLQRARVPKHLTVRELINLVRSYYPNPLSTEEILTRTNLQNRRDNRASDLSGGEERALYFALAISGNPDLLILDEPTNDLSATAKKNLWQQIKDFNQAGKTVFVVTHQVSDLQEIDQHVSRVLELDEGKIEEIYQDCPVSIPPSTRPQLQTNPLLDFPLKKAFFSQIKVELLSFLRQPTFLLTALIFSVLPALLGSNFANPVAILIGIATFNLLFIALERFGVQVAAEQAQGWTKLLQVTSLPAWVYIGSKAAVALLVSALALFLVFSSTLAGTRVEVESARLIILFSTLLLGSMPFVLVGCAIGYICNPKTVSIVSAIVLAIAFLTSLPLLKSPGLQQLLPYSPFYHYNQLQLWAGGIETLFNKSVYDGRLVLHIIWLFCTAGVAGIVAQWAYNRDVA